MIALASSVLVVRMKACVTTIKEVYEEEGWGGKGKEKDGKTVYSRRK